MDGIEVNNQVQELDVDPETVNRFLHPIRMLIAG